MPALLDTECVDVREWGRVSLPRTAVIGQVEECFRAFYSERSEPECMLLDLSASSYIEIATLQYLIALLRDRTKRKLQTKILLPAGDENIDTRHFIRRWAFAEAVDAATGQKFRRFVCSSDRERYFKTDAGGGDPGDPYAGAHVVYSDRYGEKIYPKDAYRFFGFTTWSIDSQTDRAGLIEGAKELWRRADQSVIETLKKQLRRPAPMSADGIVAKQLDAETYVVSRIVFEAMTNAVRHPGASIIQASSHMAQKLVPNAKTPNGARWVDNFLTIVYWDDGQSMLETLKNALLAGRPIHSPTEISASYLTALNNQNDSLRRSAFKTSTEIPARDSSDQEFLVATLFPGVTSDVRGGTLMIDKHTERENRALVRPGMGLHVLISTALDIFEGTVAFRTSRCFMNVSRVTKGQWPYYRKRYGIEGPEKPDYRITVSQFPQQMPEFLGNMITVRLPLSQDSQ